MGCDGRCGGGAVQGSRGEWGSRLSGVFGSSSRSSSVLLLSQGTLAMRLHINHASMHAGLSGVAWVDVARATLRPPVSGQIRVLVAVFLLVELSYSLHQR